MTEQIKVSLCIPTNGPADLHAGRHPTTATTVQMVILVLK